MSRQWKNQNTDSKVEKTPPGLTSHFLIHHLTPVKPKHQISDTSEHPNGISQHIARKQLTQKWTYKFVFTSWYIISCLTRSADATRKVWKTHTHTHVTHTQLSYDKLSKVAQRKYRKIWCFKSSHNTFDTGTQLIQTCINYMLSQCHTNTTS